jgi:hypothetical protein
MGRLAYEDHGTIHVVVHRVENPSEVLSLSLPGYGLPSSTQAFRSVLGRITLFKTRLNTAAAALLRASDKKSDITTQGFSKVGVVMQKDLLPSKMGVD